LYFEKFFRRIPAQCIVEDKYSFAAISPEHQLSQWFDRVLLPKLQELFHPNLNWTFASYLDESLPFDIHSDYYHKKGNKEPFKACLIPLSVNKTDRDLLPLASTVIFNETDVYVPPSDEMDRIWIKKEWNKNKTLKENNALQYKDQYLPHISDSDLSYLSVKVIAEWKFGDLIYWDEKLMHTSNDFRINGIKSKQAIVIHTWL
jgi:hypothetical protein